ncbi:MAG: D-alanine--poly(phosphoribitol) ligase, partial [Gemmatimonadetes bacterium]
MWLESAAERPPRRVGILASRSLAAYAGILGAWWCGASYVPLHPKLPATRLLKIQEITGLDALVVDAAGLQVLRTNPLSAAPARVLAPCDRVNESVRAGPREMRIAGCNELPALTAPHPPKSVRADDSAYIMFTSGSTGVPKGVVVTAGNVAHFLAAIEERFSFLPTDRFSQLFELNFDLSVA